MRNANIQAQPTLFSQWLCSIIFRVLALRTWLKWSFPGEHGQMSRADWEDCPSRSVRVSLSPDWQSLWHYWTPISCSNTSPCWRICIDVLMNKRSQASVILCSSLFLSLSLFDFSYRMFSHTALIRCACANRDIAFRTAQYLMQSECWAVVCQSCLFFLFVQRALRKNG